MEEILGSTIPVQVPTADVELAAGELNQPALSLCPYFIKASLTMEKPVSDQ